MDYGKYDEILAGANYDALGDLQQDTELPQSKTQQKTDKLTQNTANKVTKLSGDIVLADDMFKPDTLIGLLDADTYSVASQDKNVRAALLDQNKRYDAVELKHGNNTYDMIGKTKAEKAAGVFGKSISSMGLQRQQTADLINKEFGTNLNSNTVTEQDMIDVGNMQQVQTLADLARAKDDAERWKAPLIRGVEQTNLTGKGYRDEYGNLVNGDGKISLDLDITSADYGPIGNRGGGAVGNLAGENVTATNAADPVTNASQYWGNPTGVTRNNTIGTAEEILAELNANEYKNSGGDGVFGRVGNTLSATASMATSGFGGIADFGAELIQKIGNATEIDVLKSDGEGIWKDGELTDSADDLFGLDSSYQQKGQEAAADEYAKYKGTGDLVHVAKAAWEMFKVPENWGTSIGFLLGGGVVGGGVKSARIANAARKLIKSEKAAGRVMTGRAAKDAVIEARNQVGRMKKLVTTLAERQPGLVGYAQNDLGDQRTEYKELYKEDMPEAQQAAAFGLNMIGYNMEYWMTAAQAKAGGVIKDYIANSFKNSSKEVQKNFLSKVAGAGKAATVFVADTIGEAGQEIYQEASQGYGVDIGHKSLGESLNARQDDIAVAGISGVAGKAQFSVANQNNLVKAKELVTGKNGILDLGKRGIEKATENEKQKIVREYNEYSAPLKSEASTSMATNNTASVVDLVDKIHGKVSKDLDSSAPKEFTYGVVIRDTLDKAIKANDMTAVKNVYKTIAELDKDENVDFSAKSVIDDRTYQLTKMFSNLVNSTTESAESKAEAMKLGAQVSKEAGAKVRSEGEKIDANMLTRIAQLQEMIANEKESLKDVMGSDEYTDNIVGIERLEKLITEYAKGKKTGDVNTELGEIGFLELDATGKTLKADPSRPGLKSYLKELTDNMLNPKTQNTLLDKKVGMSGGVTLKGLQEFAESRISKLNPYKEKSKYQTNNLLVQLATENGNMTATLNQLKATAEGLQGVDETTRQSYVDAIQTALSNVQESNQIIDSRKQILDGLPILKSGRYAFQVDPDGKQTVQLLTKGNKTEVAVINADSTLTWNTKPTESTETVVNETLNNDSIVDEEVNKEDYQSQATFKEPTELVKEPLSDDSIVDENVNKEDYYDNAEFIKQDVKSVANTKVYDSVKAMVEAKNKDLGDYRKALQSVRKTLSNKMAKLSPEKKAYWSERYNTALNQIRDEKQVELAEDKESVAKTPLDDVRAKIDAFDKDLAEQIKNVDDMNLKRQVQKYYKAKLGEVKANRNRLGMIIDRMITELGKKTGTKRLGQLAKMADALIQGMVKVLNKLKTKLKLADKEHDRLTKELGTIRNMINKIEEGYEPEVKQTSAGKLKTYKDSAYGPIAELNGKRVEANPGKDLAGKRKTPEAGINYAVEQLKLERIAELEAELKETDSLGTKLLIQNLKNFDLTAKIHELVSQSSDSLFGKMGADMFSKAKEQELIDNLPQGFKDVFMSKDNRQELIDSFDAMNQYLKKTKIGVIQLEGKDINRSTDGNGLIMGKSETFQEILTDVKIGDTIKEYKKGAKSETLEKGKDEGRVEEINADKASYKVKRRAGDKSFSVDMIEMLGQKDVSGNLVINEQVQTILKFYTAKMAVDSQAMVGNILSMDESEMAKYLGITDPEEQMEVKEDAARGFVNVASIRKDIGSEVYQTLGIKFDVTTPEFTIEAFKAQLGTLVQAIAIDNGTLEREDTKKFGDKNVVLVKAHTENIDKRIVEKDEISGNDRLTKAVNKLQYLNENRNRALPTFDKPTNVDKSDRFIMNSKNTVSQKAADALNQQEKIGYTVSKKLQKYLKMNEQDVLKMFGYVDLDEVEMHVSKQSAQQARNDKAVREFDILKAFANVSEDKKFYLKWGQNVSDRYTILNDLHYQESKLHREYIVAEGAMESVDVKDKDSIQMLEASILQGLDMDPDKLSTETASTNFNKLFKVTDKGIEVTEEGPIKRAYEAMRKDATNPDVDAMAEIFHDSEGHHGLSSIELLVDWDVAIKSGEKLETHANLEIDAITSGMILMLMQIGTDQAMDMAEKGGVYKAHRKEALTDYVHKWLGDKVGFTPGALIEAGKKHAAEIEGKMKDAKGAELTKLRKELESDEVFKDLYSTIGVAMIGEATKVRAKLEADVASNPKDYNAKRQIALLNEIGPLNLKNIRSIAKSPVMVYIYGSSIGSIKRKLVHSLGMDTLVKTIESINKLEQMENRTEEQTKELATKNMLIDYYVPKDGEGRRYKDMFGGKVDKNTLNIDVESKDTLDKLTKDIGDTFGVPIETAFKDRVGFVDEHRDTTRAIEMLTFEAYKVELAKEIDKILRNKKGEYHEGETYKLSKEDFVQIEANLIDSGYSHGITWKDGDTKGDRHQSLRKTGKKGSGHSMNAKVGDTPMQSGYIKTAKDEMNTGAAVTIPIHSIDGDLIIDTLNRELTGELASKYVGGNVYDAVVLGINKAMLVDTSDYYNESMIEKGFSRSIIADQIEKLEKMLTGSVDENGKKTGFTDADREAFKLSIGLRAEDTEYDNESNRLNLGMNKIIERFALTADRNKERLTNSEGAYGSGHIYNMGANVKDVEGKEARSSEIVETPMLNQLLTEVIADNREKTKEEFKLSKPADYVLNVADFVAGKVTIRSKANLVEVEESGDYLKLGSNKLKSLGANDIIIIRGDVNKAKAEIGKEDDKLAKSKIAQLDKLIEALKDRKAAKTSDTKPENDTILNEEPFNNTKEEINKVLGPDSKVPEAVRKRIHKVINNLYKDNNGTKNGQYQTRLKEILEGWCK